MFGIFFSVLSLFSEANALCIARHSSRHTYDIYDGAFRTRANNARARSLRKEHVSIGDREKPRYTIGAQSARICTMDRELYLCWTILIGPLESRAYVSYAGAFSRRTEPLCWHWRINAVTRPRIDGSILQISPCLHFPSLPRSYDRESTVVASDRLSRLP